MKAVVCEEFAPLEKLVVKDVEPPQLSDGHAIIDIAAAGVNFPDGLMVQGLYQARPERPFIPGSEISGIVSEVADDVKSSCGLSVGDKVFTFSSLGGFSEKLAFPVNKLMALPDGIAIEEAAGLLTAHGTAHHALKQRANLKAGELVAITGAAGGTGLAAIQIAKAMGATVIAICSSEEKLAMAKDNGADLLINYNECDLKAELKILTKGKGVDVAYDTVGGDAFDALSRSMAWNGRLLVVGFASGQIPKLPVNLTLVKGYSVVGVFWGTFTMKEPAAFAENMKELLAWYLEGKVKVVVDEVFKLEDTVQAIEKVMSRKVRGKVIVCP